MKLRAASAALLFFVPGLLLVAALPSATAALGDTLVVGSATIAPGNPCNAQGPAGGVAVREAGTASILYYGVQNATRIHSAAAHMPTSASPPCLGSFLPAVSGTAGWNILAYDAYHASIRIWAARADGTNTVVGMALSGAVVASFIAPGAVTGLAVDEVAPHHLFVATGSANVQRYAVSPGGAVTAVGSASHAAPVSHLAAWGGAILTADSGDWIRNARTDGTWLGMLFHPGDTYIDPWFQVQRYHHSFTDMAYDEETYAASGKGALWTTTTVASTICIANCAQYQCLAYEGPTCIDYQCVANCNPSDWTTVSSSAPRLRAFEVTRTCPGGEQVLPTEECVCPDTIPAPVFTSPSNAVLVRGVPTSAYPMPLLVQGAVTITANGSSPDHVITLTGPLPSGATVIGSGSASTVLAASSVPRGAHTFEAALYDSALGCRGGTARLTLWVEDPTMWTAAQAIRIEGNIPAHLLAGSIRMEPFDDLIGQETGAVLDRTQGTDVRSDMRVLDATAEHGIQSTTLVANAHAAVLDTTVIADLAALCMTLTGQAQCATLPTVYAGERDLRADAWSGMTLVSGWGNAWSWTNAHDGGEDITRIVRASHATNSCANEATIAARVSSVTLAEGVPAPTPCILKVGAFRVEWGPTWSDHGPLSHESYAAAMRIRVDEGPFRGEIVIAEAYTGISLGGRALLSGPPGFVETPNDFASGADAPVTAGTGPLLAPGAYSGQFRDTDRADAFQVYANVGEKLRVILSPSHRAGAWLAPVPTAPAPHAAPRLMTMTLLDPTGVVRDRSTLGALDAHPASVELNVDMNGAWQVLVERTDTRDEAAPYVLAVDLSQVTLLPETDAPSTCTGAPELPAPVYAASMHAADPADTYRVNVAAGERITALLKPSEDADGADFDLRILDASCSLVAESALGKGTLPKGEVDALTLVSLPPGAAYVQVVRANGIGNYALVVQTHRSGT